MQGSDEARTPVLSGGKQRAPPGVRAGRQDAAIAERHDGKILRRASSRDDEPIRLAEFREHVRDVVGDEDEQRIAILRAHERHHLPVPACRKHGGMLDTWPMEKVASTHVHEDARPGAVLRSGKHLASPVQQRRLHPK